MEIDLNNLLDKKCNWKKTIRENLDIDYCILLPAIITNKIFDSLEETIVYESGENSQVRLQIKDVSNIKWFENYAGKNIW